jgi:E-phenylitaconyl-CoA hydratase
VAAAELVDAALALARRIAGNGPLAVRALTTLARRTEELPLSQAIAVEQLTWGLLRDTADRAEGRAAFADRRTPTYQGR